MLPGSPVCSVPLVRAAVRNELATLAPSSTIGSISACTLPGCSELDVIDEGKFRYELT